MRCCQALRRPSVRGSSVQERPLLLLLQLLPLRISDQIFAAARC